MNAPPAFQFYADDFIGGVMDFSTKEVGQYIKLLCFQWSHGEIPNDDRKLKLICGGKPSPNVLKKFPKTEGKMKNPRMETERIIQQEFREERSKSGQIGANKRWHSHSTAISTAIKEPMAKGMANDSSPSPSPSPISLKTYTGNGDCEKIRLELSSRLGILFHRKHSDRPAYDEEHAIAEISRRPEAMNELGEIESFHQKEQKYFPRTLTKVVTNWQSVLDSARMWKPNLSPEEERRRKNLIAQWA